MRVHGRFASVPRRFRSARPSCAAETALTPHHTPVQMPVSRAVHAVRSRHACLCARAYQFGAHPFARPLRNAGCVMSAVCFLVRGCEICETPVRDVVSVTVSGCCCCTCRRPNSWEQLVGRQFASSRRHVMCVSPETGASSSSTPPKVSAHTTRKLQLVIPVYSNNNNNKIKNAANHISDTTTFREHHHLGDENAPARSLSPHHVVHPKFNGTVHFNNFYLFHCFTYFPASACQTFSLFT